MNRFELKAQTEAFLQTQNGVTSNEWYSTDQEIAEEFLQRFEQFLFGEEDAKAERRRQYEELKKEFEL